MNIIDILLIGVALAMDAFSVSICKGLSVKKMHWKFPMITGVYFGFFQGIMPLVGFFLGKQFESIIGKFDHWIAFVLLLFIGFGMIRSSFKEEKIDDSFSFLVMILLAIATSIDALAIGVTFAFSLNGNISIWIAALIIGIITFCFSFVGTWIGKYLGKIVKVKPDLIAGIVLILIGLKILLEDLGIIHLF